MTRYAVGDLQGCLEPLQILLGDVAFNPERDQLWLVGDLINRGPDSEATLQFVKALGNSTRIVLGNHDLHFLAVALGVEQPRKGDTFTELLASPRLDEYIHWLRQQPLLYTDPSGDYSMVHAGIPPGWDLQQASALAAEVETVLRGESIAEYFANMYGNQPDCWDNELQGWDRLRVITNYFTRMRFCTASGAVDLLNKSSQPNDPLLLPWFSHPQRKTRNDQIIFGHWAALEGKADDENVFALDTGCIWGGCLTLMNLDDKTLHTTQCSDNL